jgi:hypothetical protein
MISKKILYLQAMLDVNKITKRGFALLLILFVGLLVTNEAVYKHTHHINGRFVTHSHPYNTSSDDEPSQTHQHNKAQVAFLNILEVLFPLIFLVLLSLPVFGPVRRSLHNIIPVYSGALFNHQGRDPPIG